MRLNHRKTSTLRPYAATLAAAALVVGLSGCFSDDEAIVSGEVIAGADPAASAEEATMRNLFGDAAMSDSAFFEAVAACLRERGFEATFESFEAMEARVDPELLAEADQFEEAPPEEDMSFDEAMDTLDDAMDSLNVALALPGNVLASGFGLDHNDPEVSTAANDCFWEAAFSVPPTN